MIAIDLGSNSCRFLHVNCKNAEIIGEFEAIVKTADNLHVSGKISFQAQNRIIKAIEDAKTHIDFKDETIVAVTTEAMRQASNASEVIESIKLNTGVVFEIINGEKEAKYTLEAVKHRLISLNINSNSLVLIDIGGGSTEVIFSFDDKIFSQSFKLGIVTVSQQCKNLDEVRIFLATALDEIKEYIYSIYTTQNKPTLLVATAGTPTTISAYLLGMNYQTYDAKKINGHILTYKDINIALNDFMAMDERTRSHYVGVGRENLIAAGVVIVEAFYDALGFKSAVVIDDGLREGVAFSYCKSFSNSN